MAANGSTKGSGKSAGERKRAGGGAQLETIDLPTLGAKGEACAECGAPLATDQRYCLNCGTRRAGPRLDFTPHLAGAGPDAHVAAAPASPPPTRGAARDWGGWPGAFGIGLLGVMLLIGVLIGKSANDDNTQQAAAPVVVQGQTTTPTDTSATSATPDKSATADKKAKGESGGTEPVDVGNAHVASSEELDALENCSGEECQQIQDSLGDNVATPGEAPPTDNKAPGGGSGNATVIK
jgi:hypothetical protein